jgi:hypothetical protein
MQGHRAALEDALRDARSKLDPQDLERFDAEAQRAMEFLENDFDPQGRTLALFSSQPRDLWIAMALQAEIPSQARFGPRPHLRPLEQDPSSERACFVIVDREQTRLLTLRLGSVETDDHSRDYFPRHVVEDGRKHQRTGDQGDPRQGGDAATREQASREAWADQHFEKTCERIREIERERPIAAIIVGGTRENATRFMSEMPEPMRAKVIAEVAIEIDRPIDEIVNATAEKLRERRDEVDAALVTEAVDNALAGGAGGIGWDDTLKNLIEGRARDVLVAAGEDPAGARCPEGHYAGLEAVRCPLCRAESVLVPSLLDLADAKAHETGAAFRIVNGEAAEKLRQHGGVAARLRY